MITIPSECGWPGCGKMGYFIRVGKGYEVVLCDDHAEEDWPPPPKETE